MENAASIQWKRLSVEAMAIVASILLAFTIDAWWENRIERQVEQEVLANLLVEFEQTRVELDRTLDGLTESQDAAKKLMAFAGKDLSADDNAVINQLIIELYFFTFDPPSGALESLIGAGQLNLILNAELRMQLAGWPGLVRDYKEDEEELELHLYRNLEPALDPIVPLPNVEDAAPGVFLNQLHEAFNDVRIMNIIGYISYWSESSLEEALLLRGETDQIVSLIEREID